MFSPMISSAGGIYVPVMTGGGGSRGGGGMTIFHHPQLTPLPPGLVGSLPSMSMSMPGRPSSTSSSGSQLASLLGDGPSQLRKLFIGGLSHETSDEQLRAYYSQWGTVVDSIVIRDPQTKHSRGFGFVTFAAVQMAEAAMNGRPHTINGKVVDPKRAIPREQMSPLIANHPPHFLETDPDPSCKLMLSGVHWDFHTVDSLRQHFEGFGSVQQVEILGHPRGCGFIVFEESGVAERCVAAGMAHNINGRVCEVSMNSMDMPISPTVSSSSKSGGMSPPGNHQNNNNNNTGHMNGTDHVDKKNYHR